MFVKDLRDFSGPWSGFWTQEMIRGHMKLRLRFYETNIQGDGTDRTGTFSVAGMFSESTGRVIFSKTYPSHTVDYVGTWDGSLIYGKWTIADEEFSESGDFEIWPDKEDAGLLTLSESWSDKIFVH